MCQFSRVQNSRIPVRALKDPTEISPKVSETSVQAQNQSVRSRPKVSGSVRGVSKGARSDKHGGWKVAKRGDEEEPCHSCCALIPLLLSTGSICGKRKGGRSDWWMKDGKEVSRASTTKNYS